MNIDRTNHWTLGQCNWTPVQPVKMQDAGVLYAFTASYESWLIRSIEQTQEDFPVRAWHEPIEDEL